MRRLDKEIKDPQILDEILRKSDICRLGLVDKNEAYIVPVNYAYSDGCIYIHSAGKGRKIEVLKDNPNVSFEITHTAEIIRGEKACNWTTRYRSVMGKGSITIETDMATKKKALDLIMRKYDDQVELVYEEPLLLRVVILKLQITEVSGKQSGKWE